MAKKPKRKAKKRATVKRRGKTTRRAVVRRKPARTFYKADSKYYRDDGKPDRRYKGAGTRARIHVIGRRKDGKPDMRFKINRLAAAKMREQPDYYREPFDKEVMSELIFYAGKKFKILATFAGQTIEGVDVINSVVDEILSDFYEAVRKLIAEAGHSPSPQIMFHYVVSPSKRTVTLILEKTNFVPTSCTPDISAAWHKGEF